MERRSTDRKQTTTKAFLHHPELPAMPCFTRDMSSGGVFVEFEGSTPVDEGQLKNKLQRGTRMEMTFAVDLGNLTKLYQLSVVVAQVAANGLGLSIERSGPSSTTAPPQRAEKHNNCEVLPLRGRRTSPRKPCPVV